MNVSGTRLFVMAAVIALSVTVVDRCAAEFTVALRDRVTVAAHHITVGDVAVLHGATTAEQSHIAGLDLETLRPSSKGCRITKRQVQLRVLLAGYGRGEFDVTGPAEVSVRCADTRQFRGKLERLFNGEIARQFGLEPQNISVRILDDQNVNEVEHRLSGSDFAATVLFESQLPVGRTTVQVEFEGTRGERFLQSFDAQVIVAMNVAVASQNISRGTVIDTAAFRVIRRPIASKADFADSQRVVGRIAKVDIPSNEVVLASHLTEVSKNRRSVIQRNDLLDVVVRMGRSEVRLKNAKAVTAGNIGEPITVLNTRSNKELTATVVSRNLATVDLTPRTLR